MRVEGLSANKDSHFSVILEVSFLTWLPDFYLPLISFICPFFILISILIVLAEDFWSRSNIFNGRYSESSWRCWWICQGRLCVILSLQLYSSIVLTIYRLDRLTDPTPPHPPCVSWFWILIREFHLLQFYKTFCSNLDDIIWKPPTDSSKSRITKAKSKKRWFCFL
jgi:hypothetical protein